MENNGNTASLARSITRAGSIQTYFTARLMVDRDLVDDFFRAYAYFRWIAWQEMSPQPPQSAPASEPLA